MSPRIHLYLVGEGPTEFGRQPEPRQENADKDHRGFLQLLLHNLLRRTYGESTSFTHEFKPVKELKRHPPGYTPGRETGRSTWGKRLARALAYVEFEWRSGRAQQPHGLVFIVDDKTGKERVSLVRDAIDLRAEGSRKESGFSPNIAVGTAVKMVEACLLADKAAVRAAFPGLSISRTHSPEDVANPKDVFKNDFLEYRERMEGKEIKQTTWNKARYKVFKKLDPEVLKNRCPKGLGPLVEELEKHIIPLFG